MISQLIETIYKRYCLNHIVETLMFIVQSQKMVGKLITRYLFFSPASIYICLIHPIAKIGRKNAIIICFPRLNDDPFIGTHFLPRTVISGQKKELFSCSAFDFWGVRISHYISKRLIRSYSIHIPYIAWLRKKIIIFLSERDVLLRDLLRKKWLNLISVEENITFESIVLYLYMKILFVFLKAISFHSILKVIDSHPATMF